VFKNQFKSLVAAKSIDEGFIRVFIISHQHNNIIHVINSNNNAITTNAKNQ